MLIYKSSEENIKRIFLTGSDIVLTTFYEVSKSCPFPDKKQIAEYRARCEELEIPPDYDSFCESWIEDHEDDACLLHQIDWYRVSDCFADY